MERSDWVVALAIAATTLVFVTVIFVGLMFAQVWADCRWDLFADFNCPLERKG